MRSPILISVQYSIMQHIIMSMFFTVQTQPGHILHYESSSIYKKRTAMIIHKDNNSMTDSVIKTFIVQNLHTQKISHLINLLRAPCTYPRGKATGNRKLKLMTNKASHSSTVYIISKNSSFLIPLCGNPLRGFFVYSI